MDRRSLVGVVSSSIFFPPHIRGGKRHSHNYTEGCGARGVSLLGEEKGRGGTEVEAGKKEN